MPDFRSENLGTIVLLTALTPRAIDWLCEDIDPAEKPTEAYTIPIDARYFENIALGIIEAKLTLQDSSTGAFAHQPI